MKCFPVGGQRLQEMRGGVCRVVCDPRVSTRAPHSVLSLNLNTSFRTATTFRRGYTYGHSRAEHTLEHHCKTLRSVVCTSLNSGRLAGSLSRHRSVSAEETTAALQRPVTTTVPAAWSDTSHAPRDIFTIHRCCIKDRHAAEADDGEREAREAIYVSIYHPRVISLVYLIVMSIVILIRYGRQGRHHHNHFLPHSGVRVACRTQSRVREWLSLISVSHARHSNPDISSLGACPGACVSGHPKESLCPQRPDSRRHGPIERCHVKHSHLFHAQRFLCTGKQTTPESLDGAAATDLQQRHTAWWSRWCCRELS